MFATVQKACCDTVSIDSYIFKGPKGLFLKAGSQQYCQLVVTSRLTEEIDNQQATADQHSNRLACVLSALDELQERHEVSDSARGRLRGILTAPAEGFSQTPGAVPGGMVRGSGLIRQSSRLSGATTEADNTAHHPKPYAQSCPQTYSHHTNPMLNPVLKPMLNPDQTLLAC